MITYDQGEKINDLQKARISATYGINPEILQKSEDDLLQKAGEGSRGGKVIGHTRSGKPVYANKSAKNPAYKDFTKIDHADARVVHLGVKSTNKHGMQTLTSYEQWERSKKLADEHNEEYSREDEKKSLPNSNTGARNFTGMGGN